MIQNSGNGYESAFEDETSEQKASSINEFTRKAIPPKGCLPTRSAIDVESNKESCRNYRQYFCALTAYDRHVSLINQYLLYHPKATSLLQRDTSKDKRDIDLIKENHQFLWDPGSPEDTWGQRLAKKYYDKLFKEYCICDLSRYKESKIGMRWRIDKEVVSGKGQFTCGAKRCSEGDNLRTWEMNFSYVEHSAKKNALIKLRLCHDCSYKINYKQKRKEIIKKKRFLPNKSDEKERKVTKDCEKVDTQVEVNDDLWKGPSKSTEEKGSEDEFEEYLEDLFM